MRGKRSVIWLVLGLVGCGAPRAQDSPVVVAPSYPLQEFGSTPRPAFKEVLLGLRAVREELKLTANQIKALADATSRGEAQIQQARREIKDRAKFIAVRNDIERETLAVTLATLSPDQRARLDQIQLQAQGPVAFAGAGMARLNLEGPRLADRLKLNEDQAQRAQVIADASDAEIGAAAYLKVNIDTKAGAPTPESIRHYVASPEFQATKRATRQAARAAWDSVTQRIETVLTESQRAAYHGLLGKPFDLWSIRFDDDEATEDVNLVTAALNGGGGGQQADSTFETRVARPGYLTEHPRVLFDEAHQNFHTADGRYQPFARIIASDGYEVIRNQEPLTRDVLARGRILVIANPLGPEGIVGDEASGSAFTPAECDAVRDWVQAGGSLLLITDHAPFGLGAATLARRFGVEMSLGFTSDPANSAESDSYLVFSQANQLLGDHAILRGRDDSERIHKVQTFTGQSLKGPPGSVALLKLSATAVDDSGEGESRSAAGRTQGLAMTVGKGRVVVLGEAAELSAQVAGGQKFGMNVPGLDNRQMALNIMHWLSNLLDPR